jgi:HAMP domain-containing protein
LKLDDGKRRVDAIRRQFDRFMQEQRSVFVAREESADADARHAVSFATAGLAGSMLAALLFGTYLTRALALPVRRAAGMAGRLAAGDLSTRLPETGTGEIATLERSFNTMASSLETNRDELRQLADEQAALRRVATLAARGVAPEEIFEAVTDQTRRLLGADTARLLRYDEDGTVTVLAGQGEPVVERSRFTLEGDSVTAVIRRTGRPARMDSYEGARDEIAARVRAMGLRSGVGAPITVGAGAPWSPVGRTRPPRPAAKSA